MHLAIICILIGIIAGLRAFMPLAAVCWAARFNYLPMMHPDTHFVASAVTSWIVTALALFELVNDKLPNTPSRKIPAQLITRLLTGGIAGGLIGSSYGSHGWESIGGAFVCGAIGAVIGTFGGSAVRGALAKAFGKDLPAALLEDIVAIVGSYMIMTHIW